MIELYGHPFSAFTWKPLIAAYARGVPFAYRTVGPDQPDHAARLSGLSPTGQMPALVDGDREVVESNVIIEYLDRTGSAPPMVPTDPDAALRARMLADVFDDYVAAPMQRIVAEAFRSENEKDPTGVAQARAALDRSYAWLQSRIGARWAIGETFTLADCAAAPALFYADWVHPIPDGPLASYRARLLAHPAVVRVVDEARPFRAFFPLGAPDRD